MRTQKNVQLIPGPWGQREELSVLPDVLDTFFSLDVF
jgi:hypothetical protein